MFAFKKLGYSVTDRMETAYVENGKLVVKRMTNSPYGVELGGPQDMRRMQIRVVAKEGSGPDRTQQTDADEETRWCRDFSSLKESLGEDGFLIEIDRKLEPGEASMKTIDFEDSVWEIRSQNTNRPKNYRVDK